MTEKEVVLVATDLGASGDEAVRQANDWSRRTKARLVACFVIPPRIRNQSAFPPAHADDSVALLELERRASELVSDHVSALIRRRARDFKVVIDGGRTDLAIIRVAEEERASLIVMGNRRSNELDRLLLGSVSERVVRYADCSVLIARSHRRTDHILAAIDTADADLRVAAEGVKIAARHKASITVLRCRESHPANAGARSSSQKSKAKRVDASIEARVGQLLTREKVRGRLEVVEGDPREAIARRAGQLGAELIVVGTRGRSGLARIMMGSVAETVARTASCPVLAVRLGEATAS